MYHFKTSPYLSEEVGFTIKTEYRQADWNKKLNISNATLHNLRNVIAEIPLGVMVGVAGVSGSGKLSFFADTDEAKEKGYTVGFGNFIDVKREDCNGGNLIAQGTPLELKNNSDSRLTNR